MEHQRSSEILEAILCFCHFFLWTTNVFANTNASFSNAARNLQARMCSFSLLTLKVSEDGSKLVFLNFCSFLLRPMDLFFVFSAEFWWFTSEKTKRRTNRHRCERLGDSWSLIDPNTVLAHRRKFFLKSEFLLPPQCGLSLILGVRFCCCRKKRQWKTGWKMRSVDHPCKLYQRSLCPSSLETKARKRVPKNWTWLKKGLRILFWKSSRFWNRVSWECRSFEKGQENVEKQLSMTKPFSNVERQRIHCATSRVFRGGGAKSALAYTYSKQKRRFIVKWLCFGTRVWDVSETPLQLSALLKKSKRISLKVIVSFLRT